MDWANDQVGSHEYHRADRCTNLADIAADAEAGSSNEEEADFSHFLKSCLVKDPSVT